MIPSTAHAQLDASHCGDPPVVADDSLRGEIEGEAKLLSRFLGDARLSGEIETSRKDIFYRYPTGERADAYFKYQVCLLILTDTTLTNTQKLEQLMMVEREFGRQIRSSSPKVRDECSGPNAPLDCPLSEMLEEER
jgi:hypothetical protein